MKINKGHILSVTMGLSCFFIFYVPSGFARAAAETVYISQVQIAGAKSTDDFIELYNPGSAAFNLKGFRLVKRTANGTADTLLKSWTSDEYVPAGGYYLWANSGFVSIAATPDALTTGSIAADNGIAIRQGSNDTGTVIDSLAWGTANNTFPVVLGANPEAGQSLLRTDFSSADAVFSIATGTPRSSGGYVPPPDATATSTPVATPPAVTSTPSTSTYKSADVKLSEIFPNPPGDDSGQEKVELENTGVDTVSLNGWWLGDGTSAGPKSNAYQITNQAIAPGEFLVITIPPKYFTLNNTGGDAVNLYFADKTLADSVSYPDAAKENVSYQKFQGAWVWAAPTLAAENFGAVKNSLGHWAVHLNEFLVDPPGANEGKQWVELTNSFPEAVNLKGFVLDSGSGSAPGKDSFTLDESAVIAPGGLYLITLPEDAFRLSVSGPDQLRLFDPAGTLVESVAYENAPEGKAYSKNTQGAWEFKFPTPGAENSFVPPDYHVAISEIFPSPAAGQDEFVELYNADASDLNLQNMKLYLGEKAKTFDGGVVPAGAYYVLYADDLPARLRNGGETIRLVDSYNRELSAVTYPKAIAGQSYAWSDGTQSYAWTDLPTPEAENQMVLAASTEETPAQAASAKPAVQKAAAAETVSSKLYQQVVKSNQELGESVQELKQQIAQLQQSVAALAENAVSVPQAQAASLEAAPAASGSLKFLLLAIGAFIVLAGLFFWKNPFKTLQ